MNVLFTFAIEKNMQTQTHRQTEKKLFAKEKNRNANILFDFMKEYMENWERELF